MHSYRVLSITSYVLIRSDVLISYSITIANFAKWYMIFLFILTPSALISGLISDLYILYNARR